jgi:ABC-type transporter Mla subunit MlaD
MTTVQIDKAVIERAISAIDSLCGNYGAESGQARLVVSEMREALSQAVEQEPVAEILVNSHGYVVDVARKQVPLEAGFHKVYTHPAPAKPLSVEQIDEIAQVHYVKWRDNQHFARAIIAEFCKVNGIKETS